MRVSREVDVGTGITMTYSMQLWDTACIRDKMKSAPRRLILKVLCDKISINSTVSPYLSTVQI